VFLGLVLGGGQPVAPPQPWQLTQTAAILCATDSSAAARRPNTAAVAAAADGVDAHALLATLFGRVSSPHAAYFRELKCASIVAPPFPRPAPVPSPPSDPFARRCALCVV